MFVRVDGAILLISSWWVSKFSGAGRFLARLKKFDEDIADKQIKRWTLISDAVFLPDKVRISLLQAQNLFEMLL